MNIKLGLCTSYALKIFKISKLFKDWIVFIIFKAYPVNCYTENKYNSVTKLGRL